MKQYVFCLSGDKHKVVGLLADRMRVPVWSELKQARDLLAFCGIQQPSGEFANSHQEGNVC